MKGVALCTRVVWIKAMVKFLILWISLATKFSTQRKLQRVRYYI